MGVTVVDGAPVVGGATVVGAATVVDGATVDSVSSVVVVAVTVGVVAGVDDVVPFVVPSPIGTYCSSKNFWPDGLGTTSKCHSNTLKSSSTHMVVSTVRLTLTVLSCVK